jgi:hypothetical protein
LSINGYYLRVQIEITYLKRDYTKVFGKKVQGSHI